MKQDYSWLGEEHLEREQEDFEFGAILVVKDRGAFSVGKVRTITEQY